MVLRFIWGDKLTVIEPKEMLEDSTISIMDFPVYSSLGIGFFTGFRRSPKTGDARDASRLREEYFKYMFPI
jgi:hypothetical protein